MMNKCDTSLLSANIGQLAKTKGISLQLIKKKVMVTNRSSTTSNHILTVLRACESCLVKFLLFVFKFFVR